jgi:hypothetical protein
MKREKYTIHWNVKYILKIIYTAMDRILQFKSLLIGVSQ